LSYPPRDWQSKGRGFESPRLQKFNASLDDLTLRDLWIILLGSEERPRLELTNLSNDRLFAIYETDLIFRIRNHENLKNILNLLNRFKDFLGEYLPSLELAQGFLAQYTNVLKDDITM